LQISTSSATTADGWCYWLSPAASFSLIALLRNAYLPFTIAMVVLYPIGIPLLTLVSPSVHFIGLLC
jgi:hypothetical protein